MPFKQINIPFSILVVLYTLFNTDFAAASHISTVSENAGIVDPGPVAEFALKVNTAFH